MDYRNSLSPETKAVRDAIDKVSWDWGNMCEASSDIIAVATLRAVVEQVKLEEYEYSYNVFAHINKIADELEGN